MEPPRATRPLGRGDRRDRAAGVLPHAVAHRRRRWWWSASTSARWPRPTRTSTGSAWSAAPPSTRWPGTCCSPPVSEGFGGTVHDHGRRRGAARSRSCSASPSSTPSPRWSRSGRPVKQPTKLRRQPGRGVRDPGAVRRRAVHRVNTQEILQLLQDVAEEVINPRFRTLTDDQVAEKNPGDLVTVADHEAEVRITEALTSAYPGALVLGEEATAADDTLLDRFRDADHAFTVDPVDGTKNFVHGSRDHAVMAAELRDGEVPAQLDLAAAARHGVRRRARPRRLAQRRAAGPASRGRRAPRGDVPAPVDRPVARRPAAARAHLGLLRRRLPQARRGRRRLPALQRHEAVGPRPGLAAPRGGRRLPGHVRGWALPAQDDPRMGWSPQPTRRHTSWSRGAWATWPDRRWPTSARRPRSGWRARLHRTVMTPTGGARQGPWLRSGSVRGLAAARVALRNGSVRRTCPRRAAPAPGRQPRALDRHRCHESGPDPDLRTYSSSRFGGSTYAAIQRPDRVVRRPRGSSRDRTTSWRAPSMAT